MLPISTIAQLTGLPSVSVIWALYVAHSVGFRNWYLQKVIMLLGFDIVRQLMGWGKVPFVG